jgi:hypothetical protein
MEKQYELSNCIILVYFYDRLIKIEEASALKKYLSSDIEARSNVLVNAIKLDYLIFCNEELKVSSNSMIVEIWGHALASAFANWLANTFNFAPIKKFASWIKNRSDSVDCGERGIDHNRILWDILSILKKPIALLVSKSPKNKSNS